MLATENNCMSNQARCEPSFFVILFLEYDFTAGSEAEAERARKLLEEKRKAAETVPESMAIER